MKLLAGRPYKYDRSLTEFFVQTSDTVRVKVSDLEKWKEEAELEDDQACFVPGLLF